MQMILIKRSLPLCANMIAPILFPSSNILHALTCQSVKPVAIPVRLFKSQAEANTAEIVCKLWES